MKLKFMLLIIILYASGCASVGYRSQDYQPVHSGVYPSVRSDIQMMADLKNKDYDPLLTGAEPLVFTLAALDIPMALAADTLLLPCDLLQWKSNMNKLKSLTDKYLPGYQPVRDSGSTDNDKAYFKLIASSGEVIRLNKYLTDADGKGYSMSHQLNDLLKKNNIRISTEDEAVEMDTLIFMLLNGEIVNSRWQYQVSRTQDSWNIAVVDKETQKVRLGYERALVVDDKSILQKVRRKGF